MEITTTETTWHHNPKTTIITFTATEISNLIFTWRPKYLVGPCHRLGSYTLASHCKGQHSNWGHITWFVNNVALRLVGLWFFSPPQTSPANHNSNNTPYLASMDPRCAYSLSSQLDITTLVLSLAFPSDPTFGWTQNREVQLQKSSVFLDTTLCSPLKVN